MRVTTISARVTLSARGAGGAQQSVELAEGLRQQLRQIWQEGRTVQDRQLAFGEGRQAAAPAPPGAGNGYCPQHKVEFQRFEKEGRAWHSHRLSGGGWCRKKR